jgi:hypothetical protein
MTTRAGSNAGVAEIRTQKEQELTFFWSTRQPVTSAVQVRTDVSPMGQLVNTSSHRQRPALAQHPLPDHAWVPVSVMLGEQDPPPGDALHTKTSHEQSLFLAG